MVTQDKADRKFEAIKEYLFEGKSIHSICYRYDIVERTFYRWLRNYRKYGYSGLKDGSRRPKKIEKTPEWVEEAIVELRMRMRMGCKNIAELLSSTIFPISHGGVLRVLRRLGLMEGKEKKVWRSFRASEKNEMWQIDFLGPYSTPMSEVSILVVVDDYSRYASARLVHRSDRTDDATSLLDELTAQYGIPKKILTDNGSQFRRTFDKWCGRRSRGIRHIRAKVKHPQTLGKVEAVNKMLGKYMRMDFSPIEEGQRRLNSIMDWYNFIHVHSIIGSTPAQAYRLEKDKKQVLKEFARCMGLPKLMYHLVKR